MFTQLIQMTDFGTFPKRETTLTGLARYAPAAPSSGLVFLLCSQKRVNLLAFPPRSISGMERVIPEYTLYL